MDPTTYEPISTCKHAQSLSRESTLSNDDTVATLSSRRLLKPERLLLYENETLPESKGPSNSLPPSAADSTMPGTWPSENSNSPLAPPPGIPERPRNPTPGSQRLRDSTIIDWKLSPNDGYPSTPTGNRSSEIEERYATSRPQSFYSAIPGLRPNAHCSDVEDGPIDHTAVAAMARRQKGGYAQWKADRDAMRNEHRRNRRYPMVAPPSSPLSVTQPLRKETWMPREKSTLDPLNTDAEEKQPSSRKLPVPPGINSRPEVSAQTQAAHITFAPLPHSPHPGASHASAPQSHIASSSPTLTQSQPTLSKNSMPAIPLFDTCLDPSKNPLLAATHKPSRPRGLSPAESKPPHQPLPTHDTRKSSTFNVVQSITKPQNRSVKDTGSIDRLFEDMFADRCRKYSTPAPLQSNCTKPSEPAEPTKLAQTQDVPLSTLPRLDRTKPAESVKPAQMQSLPLSIPPRADRAKLAKSAEMHEVPLSTPASPESEEWTEVDRDEGEEEWTAIEYDSREDAREEWYRIRRR